MLIFPGASSSEILHYIDVHLKEKLIDTTIVHVGVNDLLNGNSQFKINQLIENIKKMCQFWSEENICFGIGVYNKGRFANIRKSSCVTFKFLWR